MYSLYSDINAIFNGLSSNNIYFMLEVNIFTVIINMEQEGGVE